jgi:putative FmdB family regulatory protein
MPTYDYLCLDCHKKFSEILSLAEIGKVKPVCPKCKSRKVKKQISHFLTKTSKKS